jgi:hypothetical protein
LRTAGATASRIQKYIAALVLHQESPMETVITAGTIAALICAARALASETRPLRCPIRIIAWVARLAMSRLAAKMSTATRAFQISRR